MPASARSVPRNRVQRNPANRYHEILPLAIGAESIILAEDVQEC